MNLKNKFFIVGLILLVLLGISVVSATENITLDGDTVIESEVKMPTERLEINFNDNDKTLSYNVFDERLYYGITENLNYDYKVNNKSRSSGQGSIYSPTETRYNHTLKYYEDGEHNLIIHRNNHGAKTLLFNVSFNIENNISQSDDIKIQHTKTIKYSIKNGVISGSIPEEYRKLHEGWNNLTEYSILNTGSTKPVILKVYYRPYIINNTDIRNLSYDNSGTVDKVNVGTNQKYNEYNAKIIAKDVTLEYTDEDYEISIYIVDNNNNPIEMAEPYFEDYLNSWYNSNGQYYFYPMYYDVGTHNVTFTLDDGLYKAEPVTISFKIVQSIFYGDIKCKSYYGTDKSTLTMKATVNNPNGDCYEDGYVTFKVNGKSYTVKTKNGVATKTIKIKKAGSYTYTAKFTNNNYKSSAVTGKAKLFVYSTSKKARTFNIKGYKVVLSVNQFNKLVNAKNTNKIVGFEIKTNKYVKQKVGTSKTTYKWKYMGKVLLETAHKKGWKTKNIKKHWINSGEYYYTCSAYKKVAVTKIIYKDVKARVSLVIVYGGKNGAQDAPANKYRIFLDTPYQNPGYDVCKPVLYGAKKASEINKLNKAKTTKY